MMHNILLNGEVVKTVCTYEDALNQIKEWQNEELMELGHYNNYEVEFVI